MRTVPNADFAPLEQLAEHRQGLWARQREYVVTRSALYRELWQGYDVPDGLEDLASLPQVAKGALRAACRAQA